jgi:hypothetical protein
LVYDKHRERRELVLLAVVHDMAEHICEYSCLFEA